MGQKSAGNSEGNTVLAKVHSVFCTILWRNLNEFFCQPSRGLDILVCETEMTPDLLAKLAGGFEDQ